MKTEAENLARRLHDSHGGQSCAAIDMIREQAAEIERLREILARALAQMRTQRRIDRAEFPSEVEDEIRIELGERV